MSERDADASNDGPSTRRIDVELASAPSKGVSGGRSQPRAAATRRTGDLVLGRYRIVDTLGEGGMGVVHLAEDRQLLRQVALKVIKPRRDGVANPAAVARLLREAQALARLSDPHVVPAYDVGWDGDDLVVAMQYVPGQTLAKWLATPRPWRAVLDAFMQAGQGLAAAHAAGLVHRDFKPDNVIVGDDARVRVIDFGLARAWDSDSHSADDAIAYAHSGRPGSSSDELTEQGVVLGTPMYMSPEQHYGGEIGPASDQYGFCVALYRALYRHVPFAGVGLEELARNKAAGHVLDPPADTDVPATVFAALQRGLSPLPDGRWPNVSELLVALGARAPAPRRHGWLAVMAVLGIGAAFAWSSAEPSCADPHARLVGVWDEARRQEVDAALRAIDAGYAASTATRTVALLDAYADGWVAAQERACERPDEAGRTRDCLEHRLSRLVRTIDTLVATGDRDALQGAVPSVAALPPVDACDDPNDAASDPWPDDPDLRERVAVVRAMLEDADARRAAGRLEPAAKRAREALQEAEAIAWEPLVVEAQLRLGEILVHDNQHEEAEALLERALHGAAALGRNAIVVDAAASLVSLVGGHLSRTEDALEWARHGEAAVARGGVPPLKEARLLGRTGSVLGDAARFAEARETIDRALTITREAVGEDHGDYAALLYDLGGIETEQGRHDEAIVLLSRALAQREAYFGPDHPVVASVLTGLGKVATAKNDAVAAEAYFARALAIKEAAFGPDHASLAIVVTNLAATQRSLERPDRARELYLRALAIAENGYGKDHARAAQVHVNLGGLEYTEGNYEAARGYYERALAIMERTMGEEHPNVAVVLNNLGLLHDTTGDRERAIEVHTRALAIRRKALPAGHPSIALSHCNLGQALVRTGRYAQALTHYEAAASIYEAALRPDDPDVAYALTGKGEALLGLERADEAVLALERAVAIYVAAKFEASSVGRARFDLAKALWNSKGDRDRAKALAIAAHDDLTSAGAQLFAAELAEIAAWLGA